MLATNGTAQSVAADLAHVLEVEITGQSYTASGEGTWTTTDGAIDSYNTTSRPQTWQWKSTNPATVDEMLSSNLTAYGTTILAGLGVAGPFNVTAYSSTNYTSVHFTMPVPPDLGNLDVLGVEAQRSSSGGHGLVILDKLFELQAPRFVRTTAQLDDLAVAFVHCWRANNGVDDAGWSMQGSEPTINGLAVQLNVDFLRLPTGTFCDMESEDVLVDAATGAIVGIETHAQKGCPMVAAQ